MKKIALIVAGLVAGLFAVQTFIGPYFGEVALAESETAAQLEIPHPLKVEKQASGNAGHSIEGDTSVESLLHYHLQQISNQSGPKLIAGNEVALLIDGPAAYKAIFSALAQAADSIDIEMYIFDDDRIGRPLAQLLREKSRSGIHVRLIYDSVGCLYTPRKFFDDMRADGVEIVEFNPTKPWAGKFLDLNNRDHRKIFIIDNRLVYTGGINISSVYTHGSGLSRRTRVVENAMDDGWRDTQIEIRGPAVAEFTDFFDAMWLLAKGPISRPLRPSKEVESVGDKYVRIIGSSPEDSVNFIYSDLLAAIQRARISVHITMSYFSPNRAMIDALTDASRRGVEVQLVLPGFSDWWPVLEAGRFHYDELLEAGVHIHERHDVFLHAKTAVIDGIWSTVGSSNMDFRSFLHNYEMNTVIIGEKFGEDMEEVFSLDLSKAEKVNTADWERRSLLLRVQQRVSQVFIYWL